MVRDVLEQVCETPDPGRWNYPDQGAQRLLIGKSPRLQMQRVDAIRDSRRVDESGPVKNRELRTERRLHRIIRTIHRCF